jgi:hypothetical protein
MKVHERLWKELVGKTVKSVEDYYYSCMIDEAVKIIFTDGTEYIIEGATAGGSGMLTCVKYDKEFKKEYE